VPKLPNVQSPYFEVLDIEMIFKAGQLCCFSNYSHYVRGSIADIEMDIIYRNILTDSVRAFCDALRKNENLYTYLLALRKLIQSNQNSSNLLGAVHKRRPHKSRKIDPLPPLSALAQPLTPCPCGHIINLKKKPKCFAQNSADVRI